MIIMYSMVNIDTFVSNYYRVVDIDIVYFMMICAIYRHVVVHTALKKLSSKV